MLAAGKRLLLLHAPLVAVFAALTHGAIADDRKDALMAQTAAAMASADFARRHCPNIAVDTELINQNASDAGVTEDALRSDESYADQAAALESVAEQNGRTMVCVLLPSAHGGLARGIISAK